MKLVSFENPIFPTLQGEGILVGVPTTFIRLHGCDYSCAWCDTKDSWKPGSTFTEVSVDEIMEKVTELNIRHVSITGGNPLLQENELHALVDKLWDTHHQTTVETQASLASRRVFQKVHLASLSPKLHDWRWDPLNAIIGDTLEYGNQVQLKVVTTNSDDTIVALRNFATLNDDFQAGSNMSFILVPEYSLGRAGIKRLYNDIVQWMDKTPWRNRFDVRLIPQIHKMVLSVI